MKKLMLIINPAAGRGAFKNNFGEAMHLLSRGGLQPSLYFTSGPGEASVLATENAADYDIVACLGGDGTLSEVLGGLMQIKDPPPIGYFPMGTTNDVANSLGLPKNDIVGAAKKIISGTPHKFDVGGFGKDKYFSYIAAFGAFTEVSYETPQEQKKALGHLAYVLQGAAQLGKIEKIHTRVEYDDGQLEDDFIYGSLSNSTSVAGIVKFRENMVSLGDGRSELVLVRDPGNLEKFGELVAAVLSKNFDHPCLEILHTTHAKFTFNKPVAWTRDGEDGGEHTEVELCNYPAAVRMIF